MDDWNGLLDPLTLWDPLAVLGPEGRSSHASVMVAALAMHPVLVALRRELGPAPQVAESAELPTEAELSAHRAARRHG